MSALNRIVIGVWEFVMVANIAGGKDEALFYRC